MTAARRDSGEKAGIPEAHLEAKIAELLESVQKDLLKRARKSLEENVVVAKTRGELVKAISGRKMVKAAHCGSEECEQKIKEETEGGTIRCIPFKQEKISDKCAACGSPAKHTVYIAKAY